MALIKKGVGSAGGTATFRKEQDEPEKQGGTHPPQAEGEPVRPAGSGRLPRLRDLPGRQHDVQPEQEDGTRQIADPRKKADDSTRQVGASSQGDRPVGTALPGTAQRLSGDSGELHALADGSMLQERYVIEGILGIGGMSVVYRGRDMRFKEVVRHCAIKEMYQRAPDSQTRMLKLKHFEREASLLATLSHPAIPKVYDFFEENGRVYLVQELVPGKDLETVLEEEGNAIDERRVANWAAQICDVLSYLHHHQPDPIVFRDMKPSNVLLTPGERVVLIDFGIARLLDPNERKGTMIGTEGYAPPEQYRGIANPQGDLYALGATMHHLLTNNDPRLETPFTFQERPIPRLNPSVSKDLVAIVETALSYDMESRWDSAEAFKQALLSLPWMQSGFSTGTVSGVSLPTGVYASGGITETELIWKFSCEDEIRSSPCVHNGMLYVGCFDHNLYALDATTGEFRWKYATEGGINASPAVWQDIVIIGSEDGAIYGIDTRDGRRRWIFRTEKPVRSSPRVQERIVFIGSDDQHFYALDGLRGVMIWKFRAWMPFRSSAGLSPDVVFVGCDDGHVYCLEIRSSNMKWKQRTQQPVVSTPCYSDGMVFVGSNDAHIYALESKGGMPVWKFRTGHQVYSSPTVAGSRVYVGSADGNLYALDKKNGRVVWKYETESQITSTPCYEGGRVYFGAIDTHVYCLDSETGRRIWKYTTGAPVVSSPTVVNDIVYVGSMDSRVYALKA